ncbi:ester cyclase [Flexithrix dorotheae]|uniref:ester cyclase n=1 Tax=Flexithrix dorotheae TaxID=70993 RepID=UPI00035D0913|nr:ester cyclase [Flexithrix dorotheae]
MSKSNKPLVLAFVAATNEQNWAKVNTLLHENVIRHSSTFGMQTVTNSQQLIDFHKEEVTAFPDLKETVIFMVEEGELVAARIHFRGTQLGKLGKYPPSGKVLDAYFQCFFKVRNEKITEIWAEYDQLNGLIQLGHFKPLHHKD